MKIKTWFKEKPYWVQGGILGILFGLILGLIGIKYDVTRSIFWTPITLGYLIYESFLYYRGQYGIVISSIIGYLLVGIVIGWLIGLKRNKK